MDVDLENKDLTDLEEDVPEGDRPSGDGGEVEAKPEAKPELKPQEVAVPEEYDLKVPQESLLPPSIIDEVVSYAKRRGLSNEAAQEILDGYDKVVSEFQEKQQEHLAEVSAKWIEETKADKEIVGPDGKDYEANIRIAAETVAKFDPDGKIREMMNKSGIGNYPEVVKLFLRIGKAMRDAKFVHAKTQSGKKKTLEEIFYGGS